MAAADDSSRRARVQQHLQRVSDGFDLPRAHIAYLEALKASGFEPRVIYDIGACVLHWAKHAARLWPSAELVLFDALEDAAFMYPPHRFHIGVLSDRDDREVTFYQNDEWISGASYYREWNRDIFPDASGRTRKTRALDSVVAERGFPLPDLVKIDVQGCERDVIAGGLGAIGHAQHLLVEMQHVQYNEGAPLVHETLPYIESLGFACTAPRFSDNGPDADYGFQRVGRL